MQCEKFSYYGKLKGPETEETQDSCVSFTVTHSRACGQRMERKTHGESPVLHKLYTLSSSVYVFLSFSPSNVS